NPHDLAFVQAWKDSEGHKWRSANHIDDHFAHFANHSPVWIRFLSAEFFQRLIKDAGYRNYPAIQQCYKLANMKRPSLPLACCADLFRDGRVQIKFAHDTSVAETALKNNCTSIGPLAQFGEKVLDGL